MPEIPVGAVTPAHHWRFPYYYMRIKWFADSGVRKYLGPSGSPYDAFIAFMNGAQDPGQLVPGQAEGLAAAA